METRTLGHKHHSFLSGGGEMGARMRAFDWTQTHLGPSGAWPQSLKTSVSLMLGSQHPIWIGWTSKKIFLYNDAYLPVLGAAKHPWALGRPAEEVWAEIWDICGPLADKVFRNSQATFVDDVRLFMKRGDVLEETFYSFSYSPIRDESGNVAGLFCPSTNATEKNLSARRLATLAELTAKSLVERTSEAASVMALNTMSKNLDDIPFALLYLVSSSGSEASLVQTMRLPTGSDFAPQTIRLDAGTANADKTIWPVTEVIKTGRVQVVSLADKTLPFSGAAGQPLREAIVLPVTARGGEQPFGALVAGINPTRPLDDGYHTFFTLVTSQVATAIANARATEDDRRRVEALAELDRAKTAFFSDISHEFRTPLTLMLGPLREELQKSAGSNKNLELAHSNSLRLLKLVNSLLDFSRIEAGRTEAHYEPTDLATFTAELASLFQSATDKTGLRLVVDCPRLPEPVYVDRDMWEKIVLNLISNAFKFTFQGEITVKLAWTGEQVQLIVADTGVGIPERELSKIFQRFHRVRGARSRSHEGTGIGLALVHELARLHGGTVSVTSQEGSGSCFTVSIRTGKSHLPEGSIGAAQDQRDGSPGATAFVEEAARWLPEPDGETSFYKRSPREAEPARARTGPADAPTILLADDNADMRAYLHRLLSSQYRVEVVPDGQTALATIQKNLPDLVLSDVMMPGLDGIGLLKQLRGDARTKTLPILLLSARAGEEARVDGLDRGADDYLTKPFSARELLARVRSLLEMAQLRKEAEERVTSILNSITDGFHLIDRQGRFCQFNPAAVQNLAEQGWDAQALVGRRFDEVFVDALDNPAIQALGQTLHERMAISLEAFFAPWQRWYYVRHFPTGDGGVATFFQDITQRKRAEEQVQRDRERFELVSESTGVGFWFCDLPFDELAWDDRVREHFGLPPGTRVTIDTFYQQIHPEDRERTRQAIAESIETKNRYDIEYRTIAPDGREKWIRAIGRTFYDATGKPIRFDGVTLDMTQRKQDEEILRTAQLMLRRHAAELEQMVSERTAKLRETVAELEAFSHSIAHDMRAPLRSLQGYSHILIKDYSTELNPQANEYLRRINHSAERMDRLIQDVLDYSKIMRADLPLESVDVGGLLQGILETYPQLGGKEVQVVIQAPLPKVIGNNAYLVQSFSNLLGNAVKFVPSGAQPRVRIWAERRDGRVRLCVKDNGIGIPADLHKKIFGMFERVSNQYEGTGIGLAIVKKSVERMGGTVGVESTPGHGSTFWIELSEGN
jgi:PAS domain S-box-containing protein